MTGSIQTIIIVVACLMSITYLVYHFIKKPKEKNDCANCPVIKKINEKEK